MNKSNKFSPESRERAVRMVQEQRGEYPSLWGIRQRNPLGRFCAAKCRRSFAVESTKRASDHRCH
jgi:hypothetical protein